MKLPAVPAALRAVLERLPKAPPEIAASLALNVALCTGLLAREVLAPLAGKILCFEAADAGVRLRLEYGASGFRPFRGEAAADVTIRAALGDYMLLALRREDADTLFFSRRLVIEGDTDLGLVAKNALDAIDWTRLPRPFRA